MVLVQNSEGLTSNAHDTAAVHMLQLLCQRGTSQLISKSIVANCSELGSPAHSYLSALGYECPSYRTLVLDWLLKGLVFHCKSTVVVAVEILPGDKAGSEQLQLMFKKILGTLFTLQTLFTQEAAVIWKTVAEAKEGIMENLMGQFLKRVIR